MKINVSIPHNCSLLINSLESIFVQPKSNFRQICRFSDPVHAAKNNTKRSFIFFRFHNVTQDINTTTRRQQLNKRFSNGFPNGVRDTAKCTNHFAFQFRRDRLTQFVGDFSGNIFSWNKIIFKIGTLSCRNFLF